MGEDAVVLNVRVAAPAEDARTVAVPADPTAARRFAGELARDLAAGAHALDVGGVSGDRLAAFVEGLELGNYRFTRASERQPGPEAVDLCGVTGDAAVERGLRLAAATVWARDLANTRSNEKTPAWLARQAARTLTRFGVSVTERDAGWLGELGFGGVLAVGGGSSAEPRLIQAEWRPRQARRGLHAVLVGKGITFDSGGLNRKTGTSMNTMFTDMSGGAAVLGALHAIAASRLPVRVTALVPAAENMMSGSAYRPSDVVRHFGGRTSEIGNTDAEGRLVLADALAYASNRLRPSVVVDIATLTGAMKTALGVRVGGLFATSDELAGELLAAGAATGEPLWRLPLQEEYVRLLDSPVADATNSAGNPGAITAALFLRPFVKEVPWAHVDIAGPARAAEDDGMFSRGATGFGARLLAAWVESLG